VLVYVGADGGVIVVTDYVGPAPEGSSLCSQELTTDPYREPGKSTSHSPSQCP
jgi:hypothetical protein